MLYNVCAMLAQVLNFSAIFREKLLCRLFTLQLNVLHGLYNMCRLYWRMKIYSMHDVISRDESI
jgi:hypothetical protein